MAILIHIHKTRIGIRGTESTVQLVHFRTVGAVQAIGFCAIYAAAHLLMPLFEPPELWGQQVPQLSLADHPVSRWKAALRFGQHQIVVQLPDGDRTEHFRDSGFGALLRLDQQGVIGDRRDNHLS